MKMNEPNTAEKENLVIFYADDDQDDRDTFTDAIDELNENSKLFTHDCGDKLLDALLNPPPQPAIIFIDLNMPGKDGFEVLKEIRMQNSYKKLPVVIVSTSSDETSIASSRDLGANLYITKPNNYNDLKKSIHHVLNINWNTFNLDDNSFVYRNN